ncbi:MULTISPECIES: hypothetical protein [unclassified Roseateles]|uniref:hypothetical protein n=1 Tax=unclassified Roseateles TaxID=2626991 RepID=UPI0006F4FCF3|nr:MULTISPECIES: hypothetical protein [unclassified Roseateles]KQW42753.1 hypothetical protein ASC81_19020 [Pelomonas sp. Root405]KRA69430.1 hypothetical protein ASD88_19670 [Pelomonas sp. Root662]
MDATPVPPPKPWPARMLGWMGAEAPKLIASIVILVLGFWIKDSVDLAIKQRQLDLSYTKEMMGLLQKLTEEEDLNKLKNGAVVLASFGEPALPALLMELRRPDLHAVAATLGLEAMAVREPETLCRVLPPLLLKRNQHYAIGAHRTLLSLIGDNGCRKALPQLRRYRDLVNAAVAGKPEALRQRIGGEIAAPAEAYPRLKQTVDEAIANL